MENSSYGNDLLFFIQGKMNHVREFIHGQAMHIIVSNGEEGGFFKSD